MHHIVPPALLLLLLLAAAAPRGGRAAPDITMSIRDGSGGAGTAADGQQPLFTVGQVSISYIVFVVHGFSDNV